MVTSWATTEKYKGAPGESWATKGGEGPTASYKEWSHGGVSTVDNPWGSTAKAVLLALRPKQWYKNLLVFVALLFSGRMGRASDWILSLEGFVLFCALSGSIYIINDVVDREKDRLHPKKRLRPIASGTLPVKAALALAAVLLVASGFLASGVTVALPGGQTSFSTGLNLTFFSVFVLYLLLAGAYNVYFKRVVIADAMVVSVGSVLRAIAGAVAINVPVSPWLVLCTFLLALFLALAKRRHEMVLLGEDAANHRAILGSYGNGMMDSLLGITTAVLIMSYTMYTFIGASTVYMMATIPFAIFGLFRYLYLVHQRNGGGEPELIFRDRATVANAILWLLTAVLVLYLSPRVDLALFPRGGMLP